MENKINTLIKPDELARKTRAQSILLEKEIKNNFIMDFNAAALSAVENSEKWFDVSIDICKEYYDSLNSFLKDIVLIYYPWITHQGYTAIGVDSGSTDEEYYHVIRILW